MQVLPGGSHFVVCRRAVRALRVGNFARWRPWTGDCRLGCGGTQTTGAPRTPGDTDASST